MMCAVLLGVAACVQCTRQVSTLGGDTLEGDGVVPVRQPFSLVGDAAWPSPYAADPLWLRAVAGDDIDRARLAERENAQTLLAAIEHGGSLGRSALGSLEFAADRLDIRRDLCVLASRAEAPTLGLLLGALLEVLSNAPRNVETPDASADSECLRVLGEIQQRPGVTSPDKDRASGAARRLEAR